jgi:hypothetical protein
LYAAAAWAVSMQQYVLLTRGEAVFCTSQVNAGVLADLLFGVAGAGKAGGSTTSRETYAHGCFRFILGR